MPEKVKISELETAPTIGGGDLAVLAIENAQSETGYESKKATLNGLGNALNNSIEYTSALRTTSKTPIGAINEINGKWVTQTLTAGSTTMTISDEAITTASSFDFYTDKFGVSPTGATVATGTLTLTFPAQQTDISVKVRIL